MPEAQTSPLEDFAGSETLDEREAFRLVAGQQAAELAKQFSTLTEDEESKLSYCLFPETFTSKVKFIGVERELYPLPVKQAKKLWTLLKPYAKSTSDAINKQNEDLAAGKKPDSVDMASDYAKALGETALVLADFYKWGDEVKTKIQEEDVVLGELQLLATIQQWLNGANDFLLAPLLILLRAQQLQEIATIKFQSMWSTQRFRKAGNAP